MTKGDGYRTCFRLFWGLGQAWTDVPSRVLGFGLDRATGIVYV